MIDERKLGRPEGPGEAEQPTIEGMAGVIENLEELELEPRRSLSAFDVLEAAAMAGFTPPTLTVGDKNAGEALMLQRDGIGMHIMVDPKLRDEWHVTYNGKRVWSR